MVQPSQRIECDVLIVGGGAAALVAALEARKGVHGVVVACKRKPGRSGNTIVAGAAFSACVAEEGNPDTPEQHLQDSLRGGDGINEPALIRMLVSEAGESVLALEQYGVSLLRANESLIRRTPPGHSRARSIPTDTHAYTHNTNGLGITLPLLKSAQERGITLLSDMPVHRLVVRDGVAIGAVAIDAHSGEPVTILAKAVILSAGGGGHLFANTNNTLDMTGDSYAMALEAGAVLRDMEFVQFYPSMMSSPARATISSPLFGEGAVLRNRHGERFMPRYDPKGDMATRDVMSRAIFHEVQAGNGVKGGVYMDCSAVSWPVLDRKFPSQAKLFRAHSIDPATRWLVVSPATHFLIGGVCIDAGCRTNVVGLFAAGEAAGGVHGANRIAGNALSETAVFGARAGREAASYARGLRRSPEPPGTTVEIPPFRAGGLSVAEVKGRLRRAMWDHGSIVRTEAGLRQAERALRECLEALPACAIETPAELRAWLEVQRMVLAGQAIVACALERKESRGAHYRSDYPARDDERWLGSARVEKAGESLKVSFQPLQ